MLEFLNEFFRRCLFLPEQASSYARQIDALHYVEMAWMTGSALLIGVGTLWFCGRYRRRGAERTPRILLPLRVELPIYGALLAFFIGLWVIGFRQFLAMQDAPPGAFDVYVTGKQWMWQFGYPNGAATQDVLYAPAGRPVRLLLTSRDVIHSFFVPDLRLKRDAVPGMYTSIWFEAPRPGRHRIFCAELCGAGHSQMLGELAVLDAQDWDGWLARSRVDAAAAQGPGAVDLVARGRDAALAHGCFSCHSAEGSGARVVTLGPSWDGLYGSLRRFMDGSSELADEAYLTRSMMDPTAQIVQGYAPVMPSFQGQLEPPDTASIVEFIKSLAAPRPRQEVSARGR